MSLAYGTKLRPDPTRVVWFESDPFVLSMGPQHPATWGVIRLRLTLDGEQVVGVEPEVGYLHRGIEKCAEVRTVKGILPLATRVDILSPYFMECLVSMGVEEMLGVEVPARARYLRVVVMELNRILSHLFWWGLYGCDLGAETPIFLAGREREKLLALLEELAGSRYLPSYVVPGGVRRDLPPGWPGRVLEFLDELDYRLVEYRDLLSDNSIFQARTKGIGVLSREEAIAHGVTGPNLRATGVAMDLRAEPGYLAYPELGVEPVTREEGDALARYRVRMGEIEQAAGLVRRALDSLPEGPVREEVEPDPKLPPGEGYVEVESPRGRLGMLLVGDGSPYPVRVHFRPPSLANLFALEVMLRGHYMADVVAVLGSIDPMVAEIDR